MERLICALKELDLDPHANPNVFVKLEHEGVEWEWTKKHLKPPGGKTVVKIGIEPPNLPHADSRVTMKNLQDEHSIHSFIGKIRRLYYWCGTFFFVGRKW